MTVGVMYNVLCELDISEDDEQVELIELDEYVVDKYLLCEHLDDKHIDDKHSKKLKHRLESAINITTDMLSEYKNIQVNQYNWIEFLQFEKNYDDIYECEITNRDKIILQKIEKNIDNSLNDDTSTDKIGDTIVNKTDDTIFNKTDADLSESLSDTDIDRLFDMISRVMITRKPFNKTSDYKYDIAHIFGKGLYQKMKNIKEFVSFASSLPDRSVLDYDVNIKKSIMNIYLCFDVYCSLSDSILSIKEFRYDLQRNINLKKISKPIDELFKLTDLIYYHSLDSNIMIDMEEGKLTFPKYCSCRSDSFMSNQSITKAVGKHVFQKFYIFAKLFESLNNKQMKYISQIDLIRSAFDNDNLSDSQKRYLHSIVRTNKSDKIECVSNEYYQTIIEYNNYDIQQNVRQKQPKHNNRYNFGKHNLYTKTKIKTADTDMQWRNR